VTIIYIFKCDPSYATWGAGKRLHGSELINCLLEMYWLVLVCWVVRNDGNQCIFMCICGCSWIIWTSKQLRSGENWMAVCRWLIRLPG